MARLSVCVVVLPIAVGGFALKAADRRHASEAILEDEEFAEKPHTSHRSSYHASRGEGSKHHAGHLRKESSAHLIEEAFKKASLTSHLLGTSRRIVSNASEGLDSSLLLRASAATEKAWLDSGPEALRTLKAKACKLDVFRAKVDARCPAGGDCTFNQQTLLFCQLLDIAAQKAELGKLQTLETIMNATLMSTWFFGLDAATQGALVARWGKEDQWTPPLRFPALHGRTADAFWAMRRRVIGSESFGELVDDVCAGLHFARPICRSAATSGLFCQALGQAASVALGAPEAARSIAKVLQEL